MQFFFKIKVTTDINEFSQLKMALQLPLNEISQPNLCEKEPVVVTINKNIKYYTASSTSLLTTQTLKEPEVLERSSAGFERHVGVDLFYILDISVERGDYQVDKNAFKLKKARRQDVTAQ